MHRYHITFTGIKHSGGVDFHCNYPVFSKSRAKAKELLFYHYKEVKVKSINKLY